MPRSLPLLLVLLLSTGLAEADPVFLDVTQAAGLVHVQQTPEAPPDCIFDANEVIGFGCEPERMSGGAAVADVDGDGDVDLYLTSIDGPDHLYRNEGDGTFEDRTGPAGLGGSLPTNGAGFADVDNDGDPDLYLTTMGGNRFHLFINDGTGWFQEEAVLRGADVASPDPRSGYSVAFGDYDRDGWIDIHTTEWRPDSYAGNNAAVHARLLRNLGPAQPGFFEDRTQAAGVSLENIVGGGIFGFASSFTDLDGDGWQDLLVAGDFGSSRLFWNQGDGTFLDGTVQAGVGSDENGMGHAIGDFDADGRLDWFVTSIFDPDETCETQGCGWGYTGNRLYRNLGGRLFADATDAAGVREGYWGWGAVFLDYDNDGDLDLTMTNGVDFPDFPPPFPLQVPDQAWNDDPMRLWRNDGPGPMTEMSAAAGLTDTGSGKGLLTFDYDQDGDLDLLIHNTDTGPVLYENDGGNDQDWLRVRLIGVGSNREGWGAKITVMPTAAGATQIREVGSRSHFLGQSELTEHFGLGVGAGPVAAVRVEWPVTGRVRWYGNVPRNSLLIAVEPSATCGLGWEVAPLVCAIGRLRRRRR